MSSIRTYALSFLAVAAALAAAPQAQADRGRITMTNCEDVTLYICLYDWGDAWRDRDQPRVRMAISPGATLSGSCRRNWWEEDAPGCWIRSSYESDTCGSRESQRYSGSYTYWEDWEMRHLRSGTAEGAECLEETPSQFTLEGSEVSGCKPELVVWGSTNQSGESYTLRNFAMGDMRRFIQRTGSMNDWVRGFEVHSGIWRFCEHVDYGGKCYDTVPGDVGQAIPLDTAFDGRWDRRISSIRPARCQ